MADKIKNTVPSAPVMPPTLEAMQQPSVPAAQRPNTDELAKLVGAAPVSEITYEVYQEADPYAPKPVQASTASVPFGTTGLPLTLENTPDILAKASQSEGKTLLDVKSALTKGADNLDKANDEFRSLGKAQESQLATQQAEADALFKRAAYIDQHLAEFNSSPFGYMFDVWRGKKPNIDDLRAQQALHNVRVEQWQVNAALQDQTMAAKLAIAEKSLAITQAEDEMRAKAAGISTTPDLNATTQAVYASTQAADKLGGSGSSRSGSSKVPSDEELAKDAFEAGARGEKSLPSWKADKPAVKAAYEAGVVKYANEEQDRIRTAQIAETQIQNDKQTQNAQRMSSSLTALALNGNMKSIMDNLADPGVLNVVSLDPTAAKVYADTNQEVTGVAEGIKQSNYILSTSSSVVNKMSFDEQAMFEQLRRTTVSPTAFGSLTLAAAKQGLSSNAKAVKFLQDAAKKQEVSKIDYRTSAKANLAMANPQQLTSGLGQDAANLLLASNMTAEAEAARAAGEQKVPASLWFTKRTDLTTKEQDRKAKDAAAALAATIASNAKTNPIYKSAMNQGLFNIQGEDKFEKERNLYLATEVTNTVISRKRANLIAAATTDEDMRVGYGEALDAIVTESPEFKAVYKASGNRREIAEAAIVVTKALANPAETRSPFEIVRDFNMGLGVVAKNNAGELALYGANYMEYQALALAYNQNPDVILYTAEQAAQKMVMDAFKPNAPIQASIAKAMGDAGNSLVTGINQAIRVDLPALADAGAGIQAGVMLGVGGAALLNFQATPPSPEQIAAARAVASSGPIAGGIIGGLEGYQNRKAQQLAVDGAGSNIIPIYNEVAKQLQKDYDSRLGYQRAIKEPLLQAAAVAIAGEPFSPTTGFGARAKMAATKAFSDPLYVMTAEEATALQQVNLLARAMNLDYAKFADIQPVGTASGDAIQQMGTARGR